MSIIFDAIKKAEAVREKIEVKKPAAKPATDKSPAKKGEWAGISIALLIFVAAFVVGYIQFSKIDRYHRIPRALSVFKYKINKGTSAITKKLDDAGRAIPGIKKEAIAAASGKGLSGLSLEGIVAGKGEPLAIINDKLVKSGESIKGFTLIEVRDNAVRLSDDADASNIVELKLQ